MTENLRRLHPVYRGLAAVLGAAFLLTDGWLLSQGLRSPDEWFMVVGGVMMAGLFLYVARTGVQLDFPGGAK